MKHVKVGSGIIYEGTTNVISRHPPFNRVKCHKDKFYLRNNKDFVIILSWRMKRVEFCQDFSPS